MQENSPGAEAGLEAFFDFIVVAGNTRLVCIIVFLYLNIYTHILYTYKDFVPRFLNYTRTNVNNYFY